MGNAVALPTLLGRLDAAAERSGGLSAVDAGTLNY